MDILEKLQKKLQSPQTKLIPGLRDLIRRKIEGMWSNNTEDTKIEGGSNRSF